MFVFKDENEMTDLLKSLRSIEMAATDDVKHFEAHIFFDGAVKDSEPTSHVLHLVSLVEKHLGKP